MSDWSPLAVHALGAFLFLVPALILKDLIMWLLEYIYRRTGLLERFGPNRPAPPDNNTAEPVPELVTEPLAEPPDLPKPDLPLLLFGLMCWLNLALSKSFP